MLLSPTARKNEKRIKNEHRTIFKIHFHIFIENSFLFIRASKKPASPENITDITTTKTIVEPISRPVNKAVHRKPVKNKLIICIKRIIIVKII